MDDFWERFERILSHHDPHWKKKAIFGTKVSVAIADLERKRMQAEFERLEKIRVNAEIQARKKKEQEERQRQASETAIDILSTQNEHGQIRLPSGRWVDSDEFFQSELEGRPLNLEEKIKKQFHDTLEELDSENRLPPDVKNLFFRK